ncbi:hypothetical protein GM535_13940, partial [Streptococcus pneumoniae]
MSADQAELGAVFSDVDGTVVHYADKLATQNYRYGGRAADDAANAGPTTFRGLDVHLWHHGPTGSVVPAVAV